MFKNTAIFLAALASVSNLQAQLVINEFAYDDVGNDRLEYVEIYNSGSIDIDLTGWHFETGQDSVEKSTPFPTGHIIAPGSYYMVGSAAPGSNLVPGGVDFYHEQPFRNFANFFTLRNPDGVIVDSVIYSRNEGVDFAEGHGEPAHDGAGNGGGIWSYSLTSEGLGLDGQGPILTGNPNATLTWQRNPDPLFIDSDNNELDFHLAIATPRARNFSNGTVTPQEIANGLTFDFNDVDGNAETRLPGNYSSFHVQDPSIGDTIVVSNSTRFGSENPSVIPPAPAPGGGNVGISWAKANIANSGFGNAAILNLTEPVLNVEAETFVYIDAPLTGAQYDVGDYLLLRGRPDPMHFFGDDPVNPRYSNGDVGVRIRYENNVSESGQVMLYLEQRVNGETVAFGDPVEVSDNPGWIRILLSVHEENVAAIIGGTYGNLSADGTLEGGIRFPANSGTYTTTLTVPGGIGMNHHTKHYAPADATTNLANIRPPTYDHLTFRAPVLASQSSVSDWTLY